MVKTKFVKVVAVAVAVAVVAVGCSSRKKEKRAPQSPQITTLKADFKANPTQGTAPLTVNFTDKSTGNPTSWEWDFDNDGTVDSNDQNPQWTYNAPGWYTVKLTVSDGTNSNTCVKEKFIQVGTNVHYVNGVNGDDGNGGTDWSDAWKTIGKALSVAGNYDLVLVADATYNETDLKFDGKKIYLKGVDHNNAGAQPVIDCQQAGRAFYFGSGETSDSVIDNFTVQNGKKDGISYPDNGGAAILCDNSSPTIANCTFRGNRANDNGGAIFCRFSSSPTISNCTFIGNRVTWYGGAISCWDLSCPTVINCIFSGNSTTGTYTDGGAIFCYNFSSPTITNCTFSGNSAGRSGGAIYCGSSSCAAFDNCILWGNTAGSAGNEVYIKDSTSFCILNYCCVDNTGYGGQIGNITESNCIYSDPQFVDAANGNYHLKDTSPCIDAGDNTLVPSGVTTDLDGNPRIANGTVDIGAYEKQ